MPVRRLGLSVLLALLALGAGATAMAQSSRTVLGQVLDADGKAVNDAIVHLQDRKTKKGTTVVTGEEGRFQFNQVDSKADYNLYAVKGKLRSRTRGISSLSSRTRYVINLRLRPPVEEEQR